SFITEMIRDTKKDSNIKLINLLKREQEFLKNSNYSLKLKKKFLESLKKGDPIDLSDIKTLKNLIKRKTFENDESVLELYASALIGNEDYQEARKISQRIIEINQKNPNAYYYLGICLIELDKYDEAINNFEKAIKIDPNNEYYFLNLGVVYVNLKQYKEAFKQFEIVIALNSKHFIAHYNIGILYLQERNFKKAIPFFEKGLEFDNSDIEAYLALGFCYINVQKFEEAILLYKRAIKINTKNWEIYLGLGFAYAKLNDFINAQKAFKEGLIIDNKDQDLNFNLLNVSIILNDYNTSNFQLQSSISLVKEPNELKGYIEEDILYSLLKYSSSVFFKYFFPIVLKTLKSEKKLESLWNAFPDAIFDLLVHVEDYDAERLGWIEEELNTLFSDEDKMKVSLLMLNVGVRYLKKNENRAIYDLSKEERKVFKEFVLDKREVK
ncbi:MAG: tetratricopeptide repeat protein, partial [Prolixibacteraceae bacterium]|nr:tetratricopeptide repeat protein [Prolixibacteraceae bacterium]